MFELGIIQSGFWHQFALTAHSPVGLNPSEYGITPNCKSISFANNDVMFEDKTGVDHEQFSFGLKKSLFNFMHGIGFDMPLQEWFEFKIPKTKIKRDFIINNLENEPILVTRPTAKIVWLGGTPLVSFQAKTKKGITRERAQLTFFTKRESFDITTEGEKAEWLIHILEQLKIGAEPLLTYAQIKADYETHFEDFELFWVSKPINTLREHGLLVL